MGGSIRRVVVASAVGAVLVGCAGHRSGPTFTQADLPGIVLRPSEAPRGTQREARLTGARNLESFARDGVEERALRDDGFRSAYVAYFPPTSYFESREPASGARAVQTVAILFDAPEGASSSLHRFVRDVRGRQATGVRDLSAATLGQEGFGLQGRAASDGSPLILYAWRVGDLDLVLFASGPFSAEEALELAETMDGRAARASS